MAQRLKDIFFLDSFIDNLGTAIQKSCPEFDQRHFRRLVHDDTWAQQELKERMRHITRCLHSTLPDDYPQSLQILRDAAPAFSGFDAMVFPDYVECYGLKYWDLSLPALAFFTKFGSSEFAVRPFLAEDPDRMAAVMLAWAKDDNHHVRRLASEGCRPRLPWAMALSAFKKDPTPILPILETLKNDESDYVRKSVANNLNDISKDHPDLVLEICERWYGQKKHTDWIVKHACRGMLKAGNRRALQLFGFGNPTHIRVDKLTLDKDRLLIGDDLNFSFELEVGPDGPGRVRLEYGLDFVKAKGNLSRKIFQIKEANFDPGRHPMARRHSFKERTTRKHYPGRHQILIVVNGIEMATTTFDLEAP